MPGKNLTVGKVADLFLRLDEGRDRMLRPRLQWWVDRIGDRPLEEITRADVKALLLDLRTEPASDGRPRTGPTCNRYRAAFGSAIRFAIDNDLVDGGWVSPLAGLRQAKENPGRIRYLSREEEDRLLAAAELVRWPLMPLLIRTALVTGLRAGALSDLRWGDVKLDGNPRLEIERTKNGQPHVAPLTPSLAALFENYRRVGTLDTDVVFSGYRRDRPHKWRAGFEKALKLARIDGFTFHGLRHTSCSRLAESGCDLLLIAEHAGHRTLQMTKRYAHLNVAVRAKTISEVFA